MQKIYDYIVKITSLQYETVDKIMSSVSIILILWLIRKITEKIINKKVDSIQTRYYWRKVLLYISFTIGIFLVGRVWFTGIQSIATYLGFLTAGLTIALKDLITNFAGWLYILWRSPFKVSDRIQIGEYSGDVIDVEVFMFSMLEIGNWVDSDQSTGRIIHLPNNLVFNNPVINFTKGFNYIWNEIPVLITFESDWKKAKSILKEIVEDSIEHLSPYAEKQIRSASQKFMIFYSNLTPTVYTAVKDSGVLLTIRYLCKPRQRRGTTEQVWEKILNSFSEHNDIDFAYPTQRFYNNLTEGKTDSKNSTI